MRVNSFAAFIYFRSVDSNSEVSAGPHQLKSQLFLIRTQLIKIRPALPLRLQERQVQKIRWFQTVVAVKRARILLISKHCCSIWE